MENKINYNLFYEVLSNIREEFHSKGRLDDSNKKLDEIVKLLVISYYIALKEKKKFNIEYVKNFAKRNYNDESRIAIALISIFNVISKDEMFFNQDGTNVFGANPQMNIQNSENQFAEMLICELSKLDFVALLEERREGTFDIINECFGHFVRENFRNNKEDAQYMTPSEVVTPALKILVNDIMEDDFFKKSIMNLEEKFMILDPTCGVGTLPIEMSKLIIEYINRLKLSEEEKRGIIEKIKKHSIYGQDKVDRMTRLSKINALMLDCDIYNFQQGNSISEESWIDNFYNKIDIIVSNPPFGAEFLFGKLKNKEYYSILKGICKDDTIVTSELLILDKSISLLKNGGKLMIIVPDSVLSAKGLYETFRIELNKKVNIKAIIDLPSVTFAQAGTRTNSAIIYLEKRVAKNGIFMGICKDVGFVVKDRVGIPVKFSKGENEMKIISQKYISIDKKIENMKKHKIINNTPSCTIVYNSDIIDNIYKPNFYDSKRLKTLNELRNIPNDKFEIKELEEIVEFMDNKRDKKYVEEGYRHISVLHVRRDHTIDFQKVEQFKPISKGKVCCAGDILFSKINPQNPRIAVVPEYNSELVCSYEFSILKPKEGYSSFLISFLLNSNLVKNQIISLTSGTSSSHSRIKELQLRKILIPYPKKDGIEYNLYSDIAKNIKRTMYKKYKTEKSLFKLEEEIENNIYG
ncbi:N-6 DNA methylase [Vallitalea sp.]|jgi:type I restriction-modification system DNA methylase subunit|uniref:N-6 DNA methylase n=1 Tax=Vallitalea sp. TaxID=1882829 RepID=UPI0025F530FB|nr:N-6 DNA methylase [Vallitalea sp.]MCT4687301.1 N-6 DNA methylase [Vallitalea sp.]